MAHDVVRLADQFVFAKAADLDKTRIDAGQNTIQIGARLDQNGIAQLIFIVADRLIDTHGIFSKWITLKSILSNRPDNNNPFFGRSFPDPAAAPWPAAAGQNTSRSFHLRRCRR
jgi:hypothetical protein